MYRMAAVGNRKPNKLLAQYNKFITATARPTYPKGVGASAQLHSDTSRTAL
jgi:hypothetical protein